MARSKSSSRIRSPAPRAARAQGGPRAARPPRAGRAGGSPRPPLALPAWLTPERRREILGILLVAAAVLTLVAYTSRRGQLTLWWVDLLWSGFGWMALVLPLLAGGLGAWLLLDEPGGDAEPAPGSAAPTRRGWKRPLSAICLFVAVAGLLQLAAAAWVQPEGIPVVVASEALAGADRAGGRLGHLQVALLTPALGFVPAAALLLVVIVLAATFSAGLSANEGASLVAARARAGLAALRAGLRRPERVRGGGAPAPDAGPLPALPTASGAGARAITPAPAPADPARPAAHAAPGPEPSLGTGAAADWRLPAVEQILEPAVEVQRSPEDAQAMARTIEETLAEFGVPAKVVKISTGPTITQFGLNPGTIERNGQKVRVTVRRIVALQNDLALALAASPIRILAPVPGRPYVGVEVPNAAKSLVALRGVVESEGFRAQLARGGLPIALGHDTSGQPVAADLSRMPHLLVAGATGAGKSVCINSLICSLLLGHTPDRLKLILVDPKRVEMTQFRGLPHLATPVVVEVERVVGVLQWVVREMDRRYRLFAEAGARNLELFNRLAAERGQAGLPFLVIVIDELADLMMLAPEETERLITRLAQLARATGIHLVLATQRPSVDVVTGLIKANFPSRIAFAVSSSIDSRVILDTVGAEKLLGRGDMLYMASDDSKLRRLQGCFVSDHEIDRLTQYWKAEARGRGKQAQADTRLTLGIPEPLIQPELWDKMVDPAGGALAEGNDPLWDEAVALVQSHRSASTSFLQRKLRIGYARAGRLMDQLESAGLVGPAQGNTAREVFDADEEALREAADYKTRLDQVFGPADRGGERPDAPSDEEGSPDSAPPPVTRPAPDRPDREAGEDDALRPWLGD